MHALLAAAATILPAPLPTDEEARLQQLCDEAFLSTRLLGRMISTMVAERDRQKQQLGSWDVPAKVLCDRLYELNHRMHLRYMRRSKALDICRGELTEAE